MGYGPLDIQIEEVGSGVQEEAFLAVDRSHKP
jgi:hypothetical protein